MLGPLWVFILSVAGAAMCCSSAVAIAVGLYGHHFLPLSSGFEGHPSSYFLTVIAVKLPSAVRRHEAPNFMVCD